MIGIFGGTFAPIHNGHLRLALEAREELGLSEVRLIPAAVSPLKTAPAASGERRLRWLQLALGSEPGLVADDRELRRAGPSYTVDTLRELRAELGETPLCLLLGEDALRQLPRWHRWKELTDYAHLVFVNRPGHADKPAAAVSQFLRRRRARGAAQLKRAPAGFYWRCEMPALEISASDIRRRLKAGLSVRGLVPDAVLNDFTPKDREVLARDA